MKKLFMIGLAATAMLASCSNDETVEMAQSKAIGFSNAFVNNGTRSIVDPSFTTETLEDFLADKVFAGDQGTTMNPDPKDVQGFETLIEQYKKGIVIEKAAVDTLTE